MDPHAVIHISSSLAHLLADAYLPVWRLTGTETKNQLWIQNGTYATDVYATGPIRGMPYRVARAHGFLFVGGANDKVTLADATLTPDIRVRNVRSMKELETQIGRQRLRLRQRFGDLVREYAWTRAEFFNGSEIETLARDLACEKRILGCPQMPPLANSLSDEIRPLQGDGPTDEKLVSMLDYATFRVDTVIYVGAGDGRTVKQFRKKEPERFSRIRWILIDPIICEAFDTNVSCHKDCIRQEKDLLPYRTARGTTLLLWDVRTDRGEMSDRHWESQCKHEDRLGVSIAEGNRAWISLALLKTRVPFDDAMDVLTSALLFQPGAPQDMYEVRNLLVFSGRPWLPRPTRQRVDLNRVRLGVQMYHGVMRGRVLRRLNCQYLAIETSDGLKNEHGPRADLFYLTNEGNGPPESLINVALKSEISTFWIRQSRTLSYNDRPFPAQMLMLRCSTDSHMVNDGLGFILWMIWKGYCSPTPSFDPSWAASFAVVWRRVYTPCVPDVSLCRFVGLRSVSSTLRIREPHAHEYSDLVKSMGLDLSGHLYVTLVSGAYISDLRTWINMILKWSNLPAQEKVAQLEKHRAQVIEWKEDRADQPWHLREDLIAALRAYARLSGDDVSVWIKLLN
ncbi:capping enzyme [Wad Medani virus]|uniref:Core protein VP4 n=1 Tax=Wad Medani virus TaxID=40067 RepID=A0A0H4M6N2_9REOV|nr:capping enzyme [Wad Medani virus]AKP24075.1 capping enzyme [Wad Medani virus]